MWKCHNCGVIIEENNIRCPSCGTFQPSQYRGWAQNFGKWSIAASSDENQIRGFEEMIQAWSGFTPGTVSDSVKSLLRDNTFRTENESHIRQIEGKGISKDIMRNLETTIQTQKKEIDSLKKELDIAYDKKDERDAKLINIRVEKAVEEEERSSRRTDRAKSIIDEMELANGLLINKTGGKNSFGNNLNVAKCLFEPCNAHEKFSSYCGLLALTLESDTIRLDDLEKWNKESNSQKIPNEVFETFRNIRKLRNKQPPYHDTDAREIIEPLKFFGATFPMADYETLWDNVLNKFLIALRKLQKGLSQ